MVYKSHNVVRWSTNFNTESNYSNLQFMSPWGEGRENTQKDYRKGKWRVKENPLLRNTHVIYECSLINIRWCPRRCEKTYTGGETFANCFWNSVEGKIWEVWPAQKVIDYRRVQAADVSARSSSVTRPGRGGPARQRPCCCSGSSSSSSPGWSDGSSCCSQLLNVQSTN